MKNFVDIYFTVFNVFFTSTCSEVVFKWKDIRGTKLDFQSLNFGEMVLNSIIDIWCSLLNNNDATKTEKDINRIFCYTQNTVSI